jgi:hypothetical protein
MSAPIWSPVRIPAEPAAPTEPFVRRDRWRKFSRVTRTLPPDDGATANPAVPSGQVPYRECGIWNFRVPALCGWGSLTSPADRGVRPTRGMAVAIFGCVCPAYWLNSAVARSLPPLKPPVIRTLPLLSRVAVCQYRPLFMLPASPKVEVDGSYASETARALE